jgi:hypothetical protein
MPERLNSKEAKALRQLRAEFDRACRRSSEVKAMEGATMESQVHNLPMDEETRPHKVVTQVSI